MLTIHEFKTQVIFLSGVFFFSSNADQGALVVFRAENSIAGRSRGWLARGVERVRFGFGQFRSLFGGILEFLSSSHDRCDSVGSWLYRCWEHTGEDEVETAYHFDAVFLEPLDPEGLDGSSEAHDLGVHPGRPFGDSPVGVFFARSIDHLFNQTHDFGVAQVSRVRRQSFGLWIDDGLLDYPDDRRSDESLAPFRDAVGLREESLGEELVPSHFPVYRVFRENMSAFWIWITLPEPLGDLIPAEMELSFAFVVLHHCCQLFLLFKTCSVDRFDKTTIKLMKERARQLDFQVLEISWNPAKNTHKVTTTNRPRKIYNGEEIQLHTAASICPFFTFTEL
uniref:Uncharacterized protein n=1 Tax=Lygus hesperus TaxID=30085 RepID=A0A146MDK4_LYGHE